MDLYSQLLIAFGVALIAFTPGAGIYIAIPTGAAAGLGALIGIPFTILGALLPLLLVHVGYEQLARIPTVRQVMSRVALHKHRPWLEKAGFWFILVSLPWIGSWALALTAKAVQFPARKLFLAALISLLVYSAAFFALVDLGLTLLNEIDLLTSLRPLPILPQFTKP